MTTVFAFYTFVGLIFLSEGMILLAPEPYPKLIRVLGYLLMIYNALSGFRDACMREIFKEDQIAKNLSFGIILFLLVYATAGVAFTLQYRQILYGASLILLIIVQQFSPMKRNTMTRIVDKLLAANNVENVRTPPA